MAIRTAIGVWEGDLQDGEGSMELGSGAFKGPYSFSSRFESGQGTNPEELIAAAHAGCFSMALSHILAEAGFTPQRVATEAKVHLGKAGGGFKITKVELSTEAKVPGIDEADFKQHAQEAGKSCPVSQALASVEITVKASLLELD
jgi:osmotically inducible protein OsmC